VERPLNCRCSENAVPEFTKVQFATIVPKGIWPDSFLFSMGIGGVYSEALKPI
jgi:hypothetical protein